MRILRIAVVTTLLAVPALSSRAQTVSSRAQSSGYPLQRVLLFDSPYQPGIDVLDYDIALELPDTGAFIRGDVTVMLRRSMGVSRLELDLVDALTVRSVTVGGRSVHVSRGGGKIGVPLDGTADSLRVRVTYDGVVSDGLVVRKDAKGRWTWFGDNWPDRARQWLPTVDHPSDKATVSWSVVSPENRTVVANGSLVRTRVVRRGAANVYETQWRESRPIATYLMVIGVGPMVKHDLAEPACHVGDEGQCVRQSVYVMPENASWLPGVFTQAGPIVSLFARLVAPFPYEKLAHLQSSTRFGGMENASAIFYDDRLFPTQRLSDGLIAHETAHQWFGDSVTEREWAHLWLSEGFATYFAALWTRQARGDAAFRAEMAAIRQQVMRDTAVVAKRPVIDKSETEYLNLLNTNSYQKGGYVLYMLHQQLGDSAFFAGIKSYYNAHRHGNAVTADLRDAMESASGKSLEKFFEQWLERPGVAEPSIGWSHDPITGTVTLLVLQDSGRGSGACEFPLTVAVTDAAGQTTRVDVEVPSRLRPSAETDWPVSMPPRVRSRIVLPGRYTAKPRSIVFDPDERLLARITSL